MKSKKTKQNWDNEECQWNKDFVFEKICKIAKPTARMTKRVKT